MALTDGMTPADYAAINGNDGFGGNNGAWWLIILLLCGWGNGGFGFGGNGGYGAEVQRGFDQSALINAVNGVQTTVAATNADTLAAINQLALNQCNNTCQNQLAVAGLGAQVASESCATRQVVSDGFRDAQMTAFVNSQNQIAAINAGNQSIMDKLCQLELDAKNETIAQLRTELAAERSAASQNAQTAAIIANNEAQTTILEQHLAPTPYPAYIVPNPNCCGQVSPCGCGM